MAQNLNNIAYGLNQPGVSVFPGPVISNRAPTTADRVEIGRTWINVPADDYYVLTSIDANLAQWQLLATGAGAVDQLSGNAGVALPAGGNINVIGGTNITTAGAGSTITVSTIASPSFAGSVTAGTGITSTTGNIVATAGALVAATTVSAGTTISAGTGLSTATGNITATTGNIVAVAGSVSANTTVTAGTSVTAGTGITCSAFAAGVVQSNALGVFSSSNGTNGQLLIGGGAAPAWATLTAGTNIAIVNAANSITISAFTGAAVINYVSTSTTPYVATATDDYISVDASGGAKTVQLPNAPATGRVFTVKDKQGVAAINNITITTVGGVVLIDGLATYTLNTNYEVGAFIFNGTSYEVY